jgi:hypothetical protein
MFYTNRHLQVQRAVRIKPDKVATGGGPYHGTWIGVWRIRHTMDTEQPLKLLGY